VCFPLRHSDVADVYGPISDIRCIRMFVTKINFNLSVRVEQSFVIHYPNVVIKSLCGNLGTCLNYHTNAYFQTRIFSLRALGCRPRPKVKNALSNPFRSRKTVQTDAPNVFPHK